MIDIRISGVQYGVEVADDQALIAFRDPESGVRVTVMLSDEAAQDIAKRLNPVTLEIVSSLPTGQE